MLLIGCGEGGGSNSDSNENAGTLSIAITDAKPLIPDNPTELWVYFDGVHAYGPDAGWVSLPLPEIPFKINLLAYTNGHTTELITPSKLAASKFTMIRFEISRAYMVIDGSPYDIDLNVPSETLTLDVPFTFHVYANEKVYLSAHFDLSLSVLATGASTYKLEPVIRLFDETAEAATICGHIAPLNSGAPDQNVVVTVIDDVSGKTFTRAVVTRESDNGPTDFCTYWLIPNESYTVEIDADGLDPAEYTEQVNILDLEPGEFFNLNDGLSIELESAPDDPGELICGVMGDSIGETTHTNDACDRNPGEHRELRECLELRLGSHDLDWSFMGGTRPWAIARRLSCDNVYNRSEDGDEWKDAMDQARDLLQWDPVKKVIVNLGNNDVCAKYLHDYGSLAFVQPTTPANLISIEAEHFIQRMPSSTHQWEPDGTPGASISAVSAQPADGTAMTYPSYLTSSPRMDYRVNFVKTGLHYVWIRGYASSPAGYSVHVGLDGLRQNFAEGMTIGKINDWIWTRANNNGTFAVIDVPSTGVHTINIYMYADGFRLDKMVLTTSEDWVPLGTGPSESARGLFKQEDQAGIELVTIEAEHYHNLQQSGYHTWEPDYQNGYSGHAAIRALPDNGTYYDDTNSAARLDYNVNFNNAGTYYVWVRGFTTDTGDDSIHVGVDGINNNLNGNIKINTDNTWIWSNTTLGNTTSTVSILSPGIHTINIWMREDGFRLDKIVFTRNASYLPSGTGPKEKWQNDLGRIAGHIDDTMMYLTENLPANGEIYWSGIVDISKFRDMMVNRKHDHTFKKCQYLWDLDLKPDSIQGDAKNSLCKGEIGGACDYLPGWLEDELLEMFINQFQDDFKDDTPCGRMLDSRNTQEDRDEARRFNKSLNDLMEQKAAHYSKRKGVVINFTQTLWYNSDQMRPYFISHIDCFHPNRLGQMKLAQMVWEGHNPGFTPTDAFYNEGFDSQDLCSQEFTEWDSCWYEGGWGDCGDEFICNNDSSGWFKFGKESSNNKDHWIARDVGDLSGNSEVWAYFKHKRDQFDGDRMDWVGFYVWNGLSWIQLEKFKKNNDAGNHCSQYYNLTPYKDIVPFRIQFRTNNSSDMKNGDKLMIDDISVFAW
jgi:hypothetical protein